jgi:hypothetical protein
VSNLRAVTFPMPEVSCKRSHAESSLCSIAPFCTLPVLRLYRGDATLSPTRTASSISRINA